ncbi:MAG: plasma-membrane proton-efflux P-type ATPase [Candidatus Micrarchaeia archaeon]
MDFKNAKMSEVLSQLACTNEGLTGKEAGARLNRDGPNSIPEKRTAFWLRIIGHFIAPIPIVILAAAILSYAIGHLEDAAIIFFLYLLNSVIGVYIEWKADGALAQLSSEISVMARVRRDGIWGRIQAQDIVAGDLVELNSGDVVPADLKVLEGEVELDQSSLTGESLPVACGPETLAYASALVQRGHATGIAVLTGARTTFGKTAQLAQTQRPEGHLDKSIIRISQYLVAITLLMAVFVVGVGVARQYSLAETAILGLTLLVASVPAALPAVLATIMAYGAMKLAKSGVVVRQLSALEELSGVTVICSDKTGTLTENKLSVGKTWTRDIPEETLLGAALTCMPPDSSDAIDSAIAAYARASGIKSLDQKFQRYIPSDGQRKRATAVIHDEMANSYSMTIKGAPQVVFPLCRLDKATAKEAMFQVEKYADNGFRAIAVAMKSLSAKEADGPNMQLKELDESGSGFLGIIFLSDKAREDAANTIEKATSMGVSVRMVSGDHAAAARYIASGIGLKGNGMTSAELERLEGVQRTKAIRSTIIFSEVLPEEKYEIVKTLQEGGETVAVTGDGVNDAPALKRASVGIAVIGATEVARSAADLVLTKPGLSVIVEGIAEGRAIYKRMYHYITYRLAETFRVLFLVPFSVLIFGLFPLTPIQLVLLSVLNDIPILAMATDNVADAPVPERWRVKRLLGVSSSLGLVGLLNSGLLLCFFFFFQLPVPVIQTLFFLKLSVSGHLMVFHARNKGWVLGGTPPSMTLLAAVIFTQIIATLMALFGIFVTPISLWMVLVMWLWVFLFFFITEFFKHHAYRIADELKW